MPPGREKNKQESSKWAAKWDIGPVWSPKWAGLIMTKSSNDNSTIKQQRILTKQQQDRKGK